MKKRILQIGLALAILLLVLGSVVVAEIATGQAMGLFTGTRPTDLGFKEGQFKPCPWKPNCVSSTADKSDIKHYIAPFKFGSDLSADWQKVRGHIANIRNANVVLEQPGYIHVEFKSEKLGFVDDVEFAIDLKNAVIQVRSASRLGIRDFGVNRNRIESIRASLTSR